MSFRSEKSIDLVTGSATPHSETRQRSGQKFARRNWLRTQLRKLAASSLAASSMLLLTAENLHGQGFSSGPTSQSRPSESSRVFFWPSHQFNIPFDISTFGETPRAVQLEVSDDGGRSYRTAQVATASDREFNFDAPSDGLYLFRLIVVDRDGRAEPDREPPMSIIVDTEKPEADLFVDVDQKGQLVADFAIRETNFSAERVQLEYRLEEDSHWTLADSELFEGDNAFEVRGTATFEVPPTARRVLVRLRVRDQADNECEVMRFSQLPRTAMLGGGMQFASQPLNQNPAAGPRFQTNPGSGSTHSKPRVYRPPTQSEHVQASPGQYAGKFVNRSQSNSSGWSTDGGWGTRSTANGIEISGEEVSNQTSANSNASHSHTGIEIQGDFNRRNGAEEIYAQPLQGSQRRSSQRRNLERQRYQFTQLETDNAEIQLGGSGSSARHNVPAEDISAYQSNRALDSSVERSPDSAKRAYHSKSRLFELDYGLDVDPSVQIAEVQLYATVDGGATWEKWGTDRDRRSPFEIEVQEEGLFGFRMVIVNSRRQASNVPRDGDNADIWIYVDTTEPTVQIRSALYGKGENRGKLVIDYRANDENLANLPIALSYAEKPEGPWKSIASNLANEGEYAWQTAPDLPRQIFLKIDAADMAGNISTYRLPQPVNIEGLTPRGRIQGFRPVVRQ